MVEIDNGNESFYQPATWSALGDANLCLLRDLLERYKPTKSILWHKDLMAPMSLIAGYSAIKNMNVQSQFALAAGIPQCAVQHMLYFIPPTMAAMSMLIDKLRTIPDSDKRDHHLIYVPRESALCVSLLKDSGVQDMLTSITNLSINIMQLDSDVASIEMTSFISEILFHNNWSLMHSAALAIFNLTEALGMPQRIDAKGSWSCHVFDLLQRMHKEANSTSKIMQKYHISRLAIVDRLSDFVTPMLTQFTYAGLIQDNFPMKFGSAIMKASRFTDDKKEECKEIKLNASNDKLYSDIRDLPLHEATLTLTKHIKQLSEMQMSRHEATTIREYADFVRRIPQLEKAKNQAGVHTSIIEMLQEKSVKSLQFSELISLERAILECEDPWQQFEAFIGGARPPPLNLTLKLLCLYSQTTDGIRPKQLETYARALCATYGHTNTLAALLKLQRAKLLKREKEKLGDMPFASVKRQLRLMENDNSTESQPYNGFVPPLTRLLIRWLHDERALEISSDAKAIPGPEKHTINKRSISSDEALVIMYLGGVSCAELASVRRFALNSSVRVLFLTTSLVDGCQLIDSVCDARE